MAWGFKVYGPSGEIICDGTSQMLRLHASGSQYVAKNSEWTFTYSALDHEPIFIVQCDPITEDWEAHHVKTGTDWTGVNIKNRNSIYAIASTFYVWVYRRK